MTLLLKDPQAVLDYAIDWGIDYLGAGDILTASSWSVEPDEAGGVQVVGSSVGDTVSTVQVTGGSSGRIYRLSNQVTTLNGRTDDRSIVLRVEKR